MPRPSQPFSSLRLRRALTATLAATLALGQPLQALAQTYEYHVAKRNLVVVSPVALSRSVQVSSASVDFGEVNVGANSSAAVVLSNTGTGALALSAPLVAGAAFSALTDCTTTLTASLSCLTNLTFAPLGLGPFTGTLTLGSDAVGAPFNVSLSGTGLLAMGALSADTASSFGALTVGQSATRTFTFVNDGNKTNTGVYASVTGTALGLAANTCGTPGAPASVPAGNSCAVTVQYTPLVAGALAGASVSVTSAAAGSPHTLALSGSATQALTYTAQLSSSALNFASVDPGQVGSQALVLTNTGTGTLNLTAPAVTGARFTLSTNCAATLAPAQSCQANVNFAPLALGAYSGSVTFASTAQGAPFVVPVTGASYAALGVLSADTDASFGTLVVGQSATRAFTFTNSGNLANTGVYASVTGTDLSLLTNTCGTQGAPTSVVGSGTCGVTVQYAPLAAGTLSSASVSITSAGQGSPHALALSGTGTAAHVAYLDGADAPLAALAFPGTSVGSNSAALSVKIKNTGNANLVFTGPGVTVPAPFSLASNTCASATVAPSSTCQVSVTFSPLAIQAYSGGANLLSAQTNASGAAALPLSGQGLSNYPAGATLQALLHFEGAPGSAVTDSAGGTYTINGPVTLSSAQARVGLSSGYFGGTGANAVMGPNLSLPGDFTVETWVRPSSVAPGVQALVAQWHQVTGRGGYILYLAQDSVNFVFGPHSELGPLLSAGAGSIAANAWSHVAVTRSGASFRLFVNGVQKASASVAVPGRTLEVPLTLGQYLAPAFTAGATGATDFKGYLDELRVVTGRALYFSNFTPPAAALPAP